MENPLPKTLLFDIENSPNLGWYYDASKEYNILDTEQYSFIHSVSYTWEGEKKVHVLALPDFSRYKRNRKDDYSLVEAIHKLFEQADIIIGHNGDNFDIKKVNARLIYHRFDPLAPYKTADTLKLARRIQNSGSNRLDALAKYYGIGAKIPNRGKDLWLPIARGEATAQDWREMKAYNAHDTYLLAKLWPLLRPWGKTPNISVMTRSMGACPACGSKNLILRGHVYTLTTQAQRLKCGKCGKWSSDNPQRLNKRVTVK